MSATALLGFPRTNFTAVWALAKLKVKAKNDITNKVRNSFGILIILSFVFLLSEFPFLRQPPTAAYIADINQKEIQAVQVRS